MRFLPAIQTRISDAESKVKKAYHFSDRLIFSSQFLEAVSQAKNENDTKPTVHNYWRLTVSKFVGASEGISMGILNCKGSLHIKCACINISKCTRSNQAIRAEISGGFRHFFRLESPQCHFLCIQIP